MNEIITANGVDYTAQNVTTGLNTISFMITAPAAGDAEAAFREVKELTVGDGEGTAYGEYPDVEFESITIDADKNVTITMHILTATEKQIRELQVSQAEQDEAIAAMMFGGEA